MPKSVECSPDAFADGFLNLVSDIPDKVDGISDKAVRRACKTAKESAKAHSWATHYLHPNYSSGFSYHVDGKRRSVTGEVGNKTYPGLVHLLEKGHETVGGGRTAAFPHMAPAFDEGERVLVDEVERGLGSL